jgi:putative hemolysin
MTHLAKDTHLPFRGLRRGADYRLRLSGSMADVRAAQALRFEVFNVEMDEGLATSYDTGLDADPFDSVCDHLIAEDLTSGEVVGTYRMQTGLRAAMALGYYSEREFQFGPFEAARGQILELGRACVHRDHRNFAVLNLLWKGIASYARENRVRYLVGCSSLTSQDAAEGAVAWRELMPHCLAPPAWRTDPVHRFACPMDVTSGKAPRIPKLLSAYLRLGAAVCGPPAIDREFGTIDFLTLLDIESPRVAALQRRGRLLFSV